MSGVSDFDRQITRIACQIKSEPSRSLGHTTGGYLPPVVKAIRTCRPAQGFSGTLSALSLYWKRATRNEILRGLCLCKSKVKLPFCLVSPL